LSASLLQRWKAEGHVRRVARFVEEGNFTRAESEMQAAMALAPDEPGTIIQAALLHIDAGRAEEAIPLLEHIHEREPGNPAVPVFLGLAWADTGENDRARAALREAIKMQKENRVARGLLAMISMREGATQRALKILDAAGIEATGRLVGRLMVEVERTLLRLEGHVSAPDGGVSLKAPPSPAREVPPVEEEAPPVEEEAPPVEEPAPAPRTGLLASLSAASLAARSRAGRAEKAILKGDFAAAETHAREALARQGDVGRGHYFLGVALLGQKRPALALPEFLASAEIDGSTPDILYALGCCYQELARYDEARDALHRMLAAFAKDAAAHYTLGQIDLVENNDADARRHFERAAFLDFLLIRERMDRLRKAVASAPGYNCPGERPVEED